MNPKTDGLTNESATDAPTPNPKKPAIQMGLLCCATLPTFPPGTQLTMTVAGLLPVTFRTPMK